jgi:hypothetical protein
MTDEEIRALPLPALCDMLSRVRGESTIVIVELHHSPGHITGGSGGSMNNANASKVDILQALVTSLESAREYYKAEMHRQIEINKLARMRHGGGSGGSA